MVVRPQWRLLPRRCRPALSAADHGPGLRLRGSQCRGAEPLALIALELDQALDRGELTPAANPEFITLVMPYGWADLFDRHNLPQLERDVIPGFLPRQRWFAAKDRRLQAGWVLARAELPGPATEPATGSFLVQIVQAQLANAEPQVYFLPLAAVWSPAGSEL